MNVFGGASVAQLTSRMRHRRDPRTVKNYSGRRSLAAAFLFDATAA